jgi:hypothetical protein
MTTKLKLLCVFAHPDNESLSYPGHSCPQLAIPAKVAREKYSMIC